MCEEERYFKKIEPNRKTKRSRIVYRRETMKPQIVAKAVKDGKFWFIQIEGTELATQAKTFDTIEFMARDLYSFIKEVPKDSFDVVVKTGLTEIPEVAQLVSCRKNLETARKEYNEVQEKAIKKLAATLTMKEIGAVLGISNQRVSQIIKKAS